MIYLRVILINALIMIPFAVNAEDYHSRYYVKMRLIGYTEVSNCEYKPVVICYPNEEDHEQHCKVYVDERCDGK